MTTKTYKLYSDLKSERVDWLFYPYIPFGKITLLQGDPGGGKSSLIMDLIGKLTTSKELPDGRTLPPMNVIYQCSEDGLNDTIKPRLEKVGADCSRVGYITEDLLGLNLDDEIFHNAIVDLNARLLVVDPFQAYIGDSDLCSAISMRKLLRRLSMWASATNCAVVLVGHLNKKNGSNELYRGLGSIDVVATARSVLQIERVEGNENIRTFKHVKSSLSKRGNDLFFSISPVGKIVWMKEYDIELENNEEDLETGIDIRKTKQEMAAEEMVNILSSGPVEATIAENMLLELGLSDRTIKLAKRTIAVVSRRKDGKWYWFLPNADGKYDLPSAVAELDG